MRLIAFLMMSFNSLFAQEQEPPEQQLLLQVEDAYFLHPVAEATIKLYRRQRLQTGAWDRRYEGRYQSNSAGKVSLLLQPGVPYLFVTEIEGYHTNHTPLRFTQADTTVRSFALSLKPQNYRLVHLAFELEDDEPALTDSIQLRFNYAQEQDWRSTWLQPNGQVAIYFPEEQTHQLEIESPHLKLFQDSLYVETQREGMPPLHQVFQLQLKAPAPIASDTLPLVDLYFKQDSEERLNSDDWPALREWLDSYGQQALTLEVHTDARGSDRRNRLLAEARIEQLRELLENWGVDLQRIEFEAVGEARLFNHCKDGTACSEAEHQANNRLLVRLRD